MRGDVRNRVASPVLRISTFSGRPAPLSSAGSVEISRFSCMKFLGVRGVYNCGGPRQARASACPERCFPLLSTRSAPGIVFSKLNTRPTDASVHASLPASRQIAQDSRPGWIAAPFL